MHRQNVTLEQLPLDAPMPPRVITIPKLVNRRRGSSPSHGQTVSTGVTPASGPRAESAPCCWQAARRSFSGATFSLAELCGERDGYDRGYLSKVPCRPAVRRSLGRRQAEMAIEPARRDEKVRGRHLAEGKPVLEFGGG